MLCAYVLVTLINDEEPTIRPAVLAELDAGVDSEAWAFKFATKFGLLCSHTQTRIAQAIGPTPQTDS
jgi:hypothetical protein